MNAAPMPQVRSSPRNRAPAATATAGLTYVKTVARVGPTSLISSKKATKARAVQIAPRASRDTRTDVDGMADGQVIAAAGAYTSAASVRHGTMSCSVGTSFSQRDAISGAVA
ncbi:hypothetical protein MQP27_03175 [Streptomyces sp. 7R015]|uniref:Uncharacterized protein n=1 Tax=Streptomyces cylindrosporus TaxID=2927583 RepID=A0ABS9XYR2_9ACTN|nr:hypothetical protein [Streptomyces cylindrosporus]MCI3270111.1 hypothetical protein [Streptomyces cylindrosporus]